MLVQQIEALVFASPEPLPLGRLCEVLAQLYPEAPPDRAAVMEALAQLQARYASEEFAFELQELGGGYQLLTKAKYAPVLASFIQLDSKYRLSSGLLETLAIIAYEQPVTRSRIEEIRGVQSSYALDRLLERELIMITGRDEGAGRPLRYATTPRFMDFFGINKLSDLPSLEEHKLAHASDQPQDTAPEASGVATTSTAHDHVSSSQDSSTEKTSSS